MPLGAARIAFLAKTSITAAAEVYRKPLAVESTGGEIDTAQSKFGGASGLFVRANADYISVDNSGGELDTGSGDFTYECWFRATTLPGSGTYHFIYDARSTGTGTQISFGLTNQRVFFYTAGAFRITGSTVLSTATWYHMALVKSSGTTTLYLNGSSEGTYSDSNTYTSRSDPRIGANFNAANGHNGHLDDFRISDSARYTTSFTPSTTAFTDDDNTLLLLHMDGTDASTIFVDDNGWPLQLDTLVFDSETTGLGINTHNDWHWNPDGTEFGVVDRIGDAVYNYSLTSAWDETTASRGTSKSISSIDTNARGIALSADGSKMILCGTSTNTLHEFALSTNYDVTSWSTTADSFALNASNTLARGILWNDDGSELYVLDAGGNLFVYTTTTAYQLSGMSYDSTVSLGIDNNSVIAMCWANAGYNLLVTNDSTDDIYSFYCSTPYDAGTLDFRAQFPGNSPSPSAIQVAGTGSKILVYDISDDDISVYTYG